ncbi:MAG: hypothetical protein CVV18_00265 [Gammaproteobacteria bacterium HGW-Gammaproteobacteria-8]|jgi:hypothetical protein|nr:MAG: hypothetical protein CVV18_00265 [Gammaproteobacteria bacterium HGW-Gammaproteobacteria-8]
MWVQIAILIVSTLLSIALAPKAVGPEAQKADLPVVEDGKPVEIVFGDVWIDDVSILWFGDQDQIPIKSKGKK